LFDLLSRGPARILGIPVATRITAPPKLDDKARAEFKAKAAAPAAKYKTLQSA